MLGLTVRARGGLWTRVAPGVCVQRAFGCRLGHLRYDGFPTPFIFRAILLPGETADPRRSPALKLRTSDRPVEPPAFHQIDRIQRQQIVFHARSPFGSAVAVVSIILCFFPIRIISHRDQELQIIVIRKRTLSS